MSIVSDDNYVEAVINIAASCVGSGIIGLYNAYQTTICPSSNLTRKYCHSGGTASSNASEYSIEIISTLLSQATNNLL